MGERLEVGAKRVSLSHRKFPTWRLKLRNLPLRGKCVEMGEPVQLGPINKYLTNVAKMHAILNLDHT